MSTKNNPGAFRCYEAALPDEHVFTILARDPAGPATLRFWADERERVGKTVNPDDRDRIEDARRDALLMEDWREKNLDPLGDGSGPSWKLTKISDEDGGPIRAAKDPTVYVPAERDGTEAVRLNVEWLTARTRDLVEGRMSREEYTHLIELACQSPDRRRPVALAEPGTDEEHTLWTATFSNEEMDDLTRRIQTLAQGDRERARRFLEQENVTSLVHYRQTASVASFRRALHEFPPVAADPPVAKPQTSRDVTEIETPEMPPHRFAMFDKGKGWAYGRGLEINPSHIPAIKPPG